MTRQIVILLTTPLFIPGILLARTLHVPSEYSTIASALFFALPYDTVLVAPGIYYENIEWPLYKPGIKLLSEAGPELTTIDGGGDDMVIGVYASVDTTTIIRGFTITDGYAAGA